jgi:hypothetical protein
MLSLIPDRVVLEILVKRRGKWHEQEIVVPDEALSGRTIGPLQCVKPTVVLRVRMEFSEGGVLPVIVEPPLKCANGDKITINVVMDGKG